MTYKEQVERAIAPLVSCGYKITSVREVPDFGNVELVIASTTLALRFISDRGQIFVRSERVVCRIRYEGSKRPVGNTRRRRGRTSKPRRRREAVSCRRHAAFASHESAVRVNR